MDLEEIDFKNNYNDNEYSDDDEICGGSMGSLDMFNRMSKFKEEIQVQDKPPQEFDLYSVLYEPQQKIIDALPSHSHGFKGFVVMAPMGFGKTYLMAFYINWARYFKYNVVLVLAKATHPQIAKTMNRLNIEMPSVIYHSPNAHSKIKMAKKDGRTLFIVDEWNRLIGTSGNMTQVGPHLAPTANHATIGLTANLIAKGLDDLCYMSMFTRKIPSNRESFAQKFSSFNGHYNIKHLADMLSGIILVGVVDNLDNLPKLMPEKKVKISLDPKHIEYVESLPTFGIVENMREAQLSVDKMIAMNPIEKPAVVYCETILKLDEFIKEEMINNNRKYNWKAMFIHSNLKEDEFKKTLDEFNKHRGAQNVLFIGPSSKHGIEIYTGKSLIYWSPPTNLIDWQQIQGRLARPDSLSWLPKVERKIDVSVFCIDPPDDSRMSYDTDCLEKFEILAPIKEQEILLCSTLIDLVSSTKKTQNFLTDHYLVT